MSTQVQLRRNTAAKLDTFTGALGEPIYDITNKTIRVQDGSTPGGISLAKKSDLTNFGNTVVFNQSKSGKFFSDDGSRVQRVTDRLFMGDMIDHPGDTNYGVSSTYAGAAGVDYLVEGAHLAILSQFGNIGGAFGTRTSDAYKAREAGVTLWSSGGTAVLGQKYGWLGMVYLCTTAGTFGANGPSHAAGTVPNGTAQLQFSYYLNTVPIALASFTLVDSSDARGAWAGYHEIIREAAGGTSFLSENVVKNKGSNVVNDPYNPLAANATIGHWWPAGGDSNTGPATNPSTAAIVFGKAGHTWNTGIVFAADAITGTNGVTGTGAAMKMARGHELQWWGSSSQKTATIRSEGDAVGSYNKELVFRNTTISLGTNALPQLFDFNFGATPANGMTFQAGTPGQISAGFGKVALVATGTDTNLDIELKTKGGGVVWLGPWTSNGDAAVNGYIYVKDAAGTLRKIATIA